MFNLFLVQVSESSMFSLLQSDIRTALKSAFGNMDGPLSVIDWCRGRSNPAESAASGDAYSFQYSIGDIREPSSTMSIGGDSMSPPQPTSSNRGMPAVACSMNLIILFKYNIAIRGRDHDFTGDCVSMQALQSLTTKRDITVSDQPLLSSLHLLCLSGCVPFLP